MLVRRLARPMIASIFLSGGINALRNVEGHTQMASPVAEKTASALPVNITKDPKQLVQIDAAVKIGAGTMLSLNRFPRLAAIALGASLVPTTLAGHRFWEEHDPAARQQQQIHFLKNLGLLGGLMLAAVDTEGRPSVGWRTRRAAHQLTGATRSAASDAAEATRGAAHAIADAAPF